MASNNNPENGMGIGGDVPPPAPSAAVPARPLIQDYGSDNDSDIRNYASNSAPPRMCQLSPWSPTSVLLVDQPVLSYKQPWTLKLATGHDGPD